MSEAHPAVPPTEPRVSWISLLRTIRAPFATLVLAGIGLVVPPQTADMLAALEGGRSSIGPAFFFHLSQAVLALSAWYWSRALLAARFDVPDNDQARDRMDDVGAQAYDLVPRLMFVLALLIGFGMILRTGAWSHLAYMALWAAPLGLLVYFRTALVQRLFICFGYVRPANREANPAQGMRSGRDLCDWVRSVPRRLRLLIHRAPGPNWVSGVWVALSVLVFAWGTFDAFVPWDYPGLPALASRVFPGPSVALIGLALIIAPLSVVTFLFDGLNLSITFLGLRVLHRPPVVGVLVGWVLIAPTMFSLHTVRIVDPSSNAMTPENRQDLAKLFGEWVRACAGDQTPVRPIIIAVSGGASRAALWGERVLFEVEAASGAGKPRVFAVSSVSGGSLGVAPYMAALAAMSDAARCANDDERRSQMQLLTKRELSEDAVGPLLAGALLVDIPRALFSPLLWPPLFHFVTGREPRGGDRAEALERAFEHLWSGISRKPGEPSAIGFDKPFLSLFYEGQRIRAGMPLWIGNGTDMATGGRLLTVPFSTSPNWPFPAAADVLSTLGADVPISTAINNTARFPYLEPAGELAVGKQERPTLDQRYQPDGTAREIIDGGYFDNEGLQTALDLAAWLRREGPSQAQGRPVEPIIVQATADGDVLPSEAVVRCEPHADDPSAVARTRRPLQLLAPLLGLYNVRGGHSAVLLRGARAAFCPDDKPPIYQCDKANGLPVRCITTEARRQRFFHFYLSADGDKPVPLNWVLSDSAARFIWDGAMRQAGNPRETSIMHQAFQPR